MAAVMKNTRNAAKVLMTTHFGNAECSIYGIDHATTKIQGQIIIPAIIRYVSVFICITPSSAAVFKLWFYGIFLRSKTIKPRLKNCPAREACELQRLVRPALLQDIV